MKESYDKALKFTLAWEGAYVNDPLDPGGATMKGIIQRTYDRWRSIWHKATRPVKLIDDAEVGLIYKAGYWDTVNGDSLPFPVDMVAFDSAVNCGPARTLRWGEAAYNPNATIWANNLISLRVANYNSIIAAKPSQKRFYKGWMNRINSLRSAIK